ncbi:MAG: glycosyltransferase [Chromatiales bacterium]|jgi:glycosyltransferase involved in cell wall biosynthesis
MKTSPVTISLTRYNEPNWLLLQTLESLANQKGIEAEVLFLDQMDDPEIQSKVDSLNSDTIKFKRRLIPAKSLSYARNLAIQEAENDLILFIDSDAIADKHWAHNLASAFNNPDVAIAGGRISLKWHKKPLAIAKARIVQEQYSGLELGADTIPVHRIVGASFAINRKLLAENAYFDESLGRREGKLYSGEESDLCKRTLEAGHIILYKGNSYVQHQVLPERIRYRWIFTRLFYAGFGRSRSGGTPSPSHNIKFWDYFFLPIILPFYLAGFITEKLQQ